MAISTHDASGVPVSEPSVSEPSVSDLSVSEPPAPRRRGRPPAAVAARTRAEIRLAALELFADKGFHATGVAEIGDRAGVRRGALYYHIGSKEELLYGILRDHAEALYAQARAVADDARDPVAALRTLIHGRVRLVVAQRREVAVELRDGAAVRGTRATELAALRDRIRYCWQRVLDSGSATGVLAPADPVVLDGLLGMLNSVALWYRPDGPGPERIADRLAGMVLDGLRVSGPAR